MISNLPIIKNRERIINAIKKNQVIILESPTGSGKTTQLPIMIYEEDLALGKIIGMTQPRRIASISVSEFIKKQLEESGILREDDNVAYKIRFNDESNENTKIKIMTDGILLQEIKADSLLSEYGVIIIDEAHERSLNIDFALGLIKILLKKRKDLKVIISSATINTKIFSKYFDDAPIVKIEGKSYNVDVFYSPPTSKKMEALLSKIKDIVGQRINEDNGDILIFLDGEKNIKACCNMLKEEYEDRVWCIPLYGKLSKEYQDLVFKKPPDGKIKIVASTNIAETSITIDGVSTVIDSGIAKMNFFNSQTFISHLTEMGISKSSAEQRKGRAGRTSAGVCYRLYTKEEFEAKRLYAKEEIYRTDLSEVILRIAEIGVANFDGFDFISPPRREEFHLSVEALKNMSVLNNDNTLTDIGKIMTSFPLLPKHSRIIVESILRYPDVISDVITIVSFLSTPSPMLYPPSLEEEAKEAHFNIKDPDGDIFAYLKLMIDFSNSSNKGSFCRERFLDFEGMMEIYNVKNQIEDIVYKMGTPILSNTENREHIICSLIPGLMQFVCFKTKNKYKTIKADYIDIHPSSCMYKDQPEYIIAGEIMKTQRMFARSVAAVKKKLLKNKFPHLLDMFEEKKKEDRNRIKNRDEEIESLGQEFTVKKKKKLDIKIDFTKYSIFIDKALSSPQLLSQSNIRLMKGDKLVYQGKSKLVIDYIKKINSSTEIKELSKKNSSFTLKDGNREIKRVLSKIGELGKIKRNIGILTLYSSGEDRYSLKISNSVTSFFSESYFSFSAFLSGIENFRQENIMQVDLIKSKFEAIRKINRDI